MPNYAIAFGQKNTPERCSFRGENNEAPRFRGAIEATPYSDDHHLTVTFGVTVATGDETFDSALKRADDNLYSGKTTGKNKVVAE